LTKYRFVFDGGEYGNTITAIDCEIELQKCSDFGVFITEENMTVDLICGKYEVGADLPAGYYRISMIAKPSDFVEDFIISGPCIQIFDENGIGIIEDGIKQLSSSKEVFLRDGYIIEIEACHARIEKV
jgi:hypothetical protein